MATITKEQALKFYSSVQAKIDALNAQISTMSADANVSPEAKEAGVSTLKNQIALLNEQISNVVKKSGVPVPGTEKDEPVSRKRMDVLNEGIDPASALKAISLWADRFELRAALVSNDALAEISRLLSNAQVKIKALGDKAI